MEVKEISRPNFDIRFTAFTSPIPSTPENQQRMLEKIVCPFFIHKFFVARELRDAAQLRTDYRELNRFELYSQLSQLNEL
jgi:hypothetical protein